MRESEAGVDDTFLYELARERKTTALVGHMKHADNPVIRRRAAELLGDFSDIHRPYDREEVVRELIAVVTDDTEHDAVRARAVDALYRHGREPIERLVTELAAFDAGEAADWTTAEELADWLESDQPEFRMVAATALAEFADPGDTAALEALVGAFDDPDPRVRERSLRSCGTIGDDRVVEPVAGLVEDSNPRVRRAAANALVDIGSAAALEALIPVARAADERLRRIAVGELGELGDRRPLVVLVRALEDDSEDVRRAAILSLIELLAAGDPQLRDEILDQLRRADPPELVSQLVNIGAESPRPETRADVAWLLGRIVDPAAERADDAVEALLTALDDDSELVADRAASSLRRLGADAVGSRLQIFVREDTASPAAVERAETLLEELGVGEGSEVVNNSVDYTYVREPADYTERRESE